ncbi:MAG: DnaD domain-containing protein [Tepidiformaceae bacterium]
MNGGATFAGFPAVARATAIPNLFFAAVLPVLREGGDVLAFLWVSRLVQEQRGEARCVSAAQVWGAPGAAASFEAMGGAREGLDRGLARCAEAGALLAVQLTGAGGAECVYFVNNPGSRRAVARARTGELRIKPETLAEAVPATSRPGIFRLYEEHVGTITPMVGEKLLHAQETYPAAWVEEAFREAAELNRRNWRYIERILAKWAEEGRGNEGAQGDSFEARRRRYLGSFADSPGR